MATVGQKDILSDYDDTGILGDEIDLVAEEADLTQERLKVGVRR